MNQSQNSYHNNHFPLFLVGKTYPECIKYQWLLDHDRRYTYSSSTNRKCDNYLSGWYRFGGAAGTKMLTSCYSRYRCNTDQPGYLSGSHPSVSDGKVSRTVYFHHYSYGCTHYSRTIQVINCADLYYVYKLNGVPSCNARYCSAV